MGLLQDAIDHVCKQHEDEHHGEANFRQLDKHKAEDVINRMKNTELIDMLEQLLDR